MLGCDATSTCFGRAARSALGARVVLVVVQRLGHGSTACGGRPVGGADAVARAQRRRRAAEQIVERGRPGRRHDAGVVVQKHELRKGALEREAEEQRGLRKLREHRRHAPLRRKLARRAAAELQQRRRRVEEGVGVAVAPRVERGGARRPVHVRRGAARRCRSTCSSSPALPSPATGVGAGEKRRAVRCGSAAVGQRGDSAPTVAHEGVGQRRRRLRPADHGIDMRRATVSSSDRGTVWRLAAISALVGASSPSVTTTIEPPRQCNARNR